MNHLFRHSEPLIIAHRGASAHAPENTLSAFRLALEQDANAVELDVKLTADHQVVVIHDHSVDRTTGAHGDVGKMSFASLRALDAGSFFDPRFAGEKIPSLEEVFETLGKKLLINVELTNYVSPFDALPDEVAKKVIHCGMQEHVFFSSFLQLNILRIKKLLPNTPVALLAAEGASGWVARSFLGRKASPHIIHPYFTDVTQDFMRVEKEAKRRVHAWTVNDPLEMQRLFTLGVDGIFTDDPAGARQVLKKMKG